MDWYKGAGLAPGNAPQESLSVLTQNGRVNALVI